MKKEKHKYIRISSFDCPFLSSVHNLLLFFFFFSLSFCPVTNPLSLLLVHFRHGAYNRTVIIHKSEDKKHKWMWLTVNNRVDENTEIFSFLSLCKHTHKKSEANLPASHGEMLWWEKKIESGHEAQWHSKDYSLGMKMGRR